MTEHRFSDEWLVRAIQNIPGIESSVVGLFRKENLPSVEEALIDRNYLKQEDLEEAVAKTYKIQPAHIELKDIDRLALNLIPERLCKRFAILPIRLQEDRIEVAMNNPLNIDTIADLELVSGRKVEPFYCSKRKFDFLFSELFNVGSLLYDLLEKVGDVEHLEILADERNQVVKELTSDLEAPVIKLVNSIIVKAYRQKASDIHIEQNDQKTDVRYRIDGILKNFLTIPKHIGVGPLVSRIKIMANLDVADHLRPQDGRAKLKISGSEIGLRVSILPTNFGEKVVMRLLDPKSAEMPLEGMGFGSNNIARLDAVMQAPQGMIIVTGPTGSGKTTTLYSMLNKLKSEETNIVTVEDPIEYKLKGINQVQVNEKQGLGFAGVLRSVLRQDPDIILVGEIRDVETASIAFQAALTGHLVFSTLHTNDTVSTLSRLFDMGVERFKIAPAILAITAQRLVRRLCPDCKKEVPLADRNPQIINLLKNNGHSGTYFKAGGCDKCLFSGYRGRLALLEFLQTTREIREKIGAGADEASIRQLALSQKTLQTMLDDALWHLSRGDTSLDEIRPYVSSDDKGTMEAAVKGDSIKNQDDIHVVSTLSSKGGVFSGVPSPAIPASMASAKKILIADDDPVIRMTLRAMMEKNGFQVFESEDGQAALQQIKNAPPNLLLLDLNMPQMDGQDVIRFLKQDPDNSGIPIIVLTSEEDEKNQEETLNAGADDYIVKPLKPALVLARVKAALRRNQD